MSFDISKFGNNKLNVPASFKLIHPDGTITKSKVHIYSMKSDIAISKLNEFSREKVHGGNIILTEIRQDIDLCCAITESIEGIEIGSKDNVFDLELDQGVVVSNKDNIRKLISNFPFIRQQIAVNASNDMIFYGKDEKVS